MKSAPLIPPVIALVLSVGWLGARHRVLVELQREGSELREKAAVGNGDGKTRDALSTVGSEPLDLASLVAQALKANRTGAGGKKLMEHFSAMSGEEILKTISDVSKMNSDAKWILRDLLVQALVEKDPAFALRHLLSLADVRIQTAVSYTLSQGLKNWAAKDPAAAGRWFDSELEKGTFASKRLDGSNQRLNSLQSALIGALMTSDPADATKRLAALPEGIREGALNDHANHPIDEGGQAAFAKMIRELVPPDAQRRLLANQARQLASSGGFPQVEGYLDRIGPSPDTIPSN